MCGIAGFLGNYDQGLLERMARILAHRGPDDSGVLWLPEAGLGLAHTRLSIIDLTPTGHQPMWDAESRVVVAYNGEIYNYRELRGELEERGYRFQGTSDTEVLLNLYLDQGPACLEQLNGIFALALWDAQQNQLLLARDGLGVKPLYWAETPRGLLFASEMKALLAAPDLGRELDLEALNHYLTYLWCPAPATALRQVRKLEPGQAVILRPGQARRWWYFYDPPLAAPQRRVGPEQAVNEVRERLATAVRRQMVADVPVGAFLSGGLDSSALVHFAREHASPGRLQCFTIGFTEDLSADEGFVDDLPYARRAAQALEVDLHEVRVGPEMFERLDAMLYHLDEPQADPAVLDAMFISQLARSKGIKVLLSGAGGDDVYTGYRRHHALLLERYWAWLPRPARRLLSRMAGRLPQGTTLGRRLAKALRFAHLEPGPRLASYFHWIQPQQLNRLYTPEVRKKLAGQGFSAPLMRSLERLGTQASPLNQMLYLELKHFLADHNLNYADKMGMAHGVEVRVPFLDRDLVAHAATLPQRYKLRGATSKWVLRRAMEPYLPSEIIKRPKTGFGVPLRRWMRHRMQDKVAELLSPGTLRARGLFDPDQVGRLIQQDQQGQIDATYIIFSLMCIESWCRIFLDRPSQPGKD